MAFTINKHLVFIDSKQYMNSRLVALVKYLPDHNFKFLLQEFSGEFLKWAKQKGVYPYEYMGSFKEIFADKLPERFEFF